MDLNFYNKEIMEAVDSLIGLNIDLMRDKYRVVSLEVEPKSDSLLYISDKENNPSPLYLPLDAIIGQHVLRRGSWENVLPRFVSHVMQGCDSQFSLVDIGANIGLFTRQCLNLLDPEKLDQCWCYEPESNNYNLLKRNIGSSTGVILHNYGLGERNEVCELYIDPVNVGNYSTNKNAVNVGS